ncbi:MAG: hypothetical protein PHV16_04460 [Candidatus Nanoarchaeia archaeon]|nr:hypothetical protein [Candidatus Nanoarchaeia archaeon]
MENQYNEDNMYFKIKDAVKNINCKESRDFISTIPYKNWIRYAVNGLRDKDRIDVLSKIISSNYAEVENNGYKENKERYLNLIIDPLIKASGNKKQKEGFRKTIQEMASIQGEKKVYDAIINHPLVYSKKINKTKKYKELEKTIEKLEKSILKKYK